MITPTHTNIDISDLYIIIGLSITILSYCLNNARRLVTDPDTGETNIIGGLDLPQDLLGSDTIIVGLELFRLYLAITHVFTNYVTVSLNDIPIDQLHIILLNLQGVIAMHGLTHTFLNTYSEIWDITDPFFQEFVFIHIGWREVCTNLMGLYRSIENILYIPENASRIPINAFDR